MELKNVVAENVGKVPQMLVSETGKEAHGAPGGRSQEETGD